MSDAPTNDMSDNSGSGPFDLGGLGPKLARLAQDDESLACLEVFAQLLDLDDDATRPHLMTILLNPRGDLQILTVGHAGPGLTVQVDESRELDIPQLFFAEGALDER